MQYCIKYGVIHMIGTNAFGCISSTMPCIKRCTLSLIIHDKIVIYSLKKYTYS